METMDNDDSFRSATNSGAQASIIWCACGLAKMHSSLLEQWVEQSASEVSHPKAMVAMLEHTAEAQWALSILIDRLYTLSDRYHLDLFLCSIPQMVDPPDSVMEVANPKGAVSKWSKPVGLGFVRAF